MNERSAGYSGTPLFKKLGINEKFRVRLYNAPEDYFELLGKIPDNATFVKRLVKDLEMVHLFVNKRNELEKEVKRHLKYIKQDGMIWVS